MQRVRVLLFLLLVSLALSPQPVFADSVLNDLLPSVFGPRDRGPKPEETLIAPFAQDAGATRRMTTEQEKALAKPENLAPITVAHRSRAYMQQWAADQAASILTYNPADSDPGSKDGTVAQAEKYKKAWLESAQADVQALLTTPYFTERLGNRNLRIKGFVQTTATVQNEGLFGDAYRWLVDVPVTITFFPQGAAADDALKSTGYETTTVMMRLQIVRVATGYPDGCAVERFTNTAPMP